MKSICNSNSTPKEKDEAISVILMASFPAKLAAFSFLFYAFFSLLTVLFHLYTE
jgi:hypothetical protein